jgi:opacity protein-like surface antigen
MKRTSRWSLIGAVALASTLGVSALQAQANPIAFGVVAGASVPLGDFGDFAKTGWHAGGLVQWNGAAFPLGIRGEVVYHSFGSEQTVGGEDVDFNLLTATVNGVFMFPMTEPATVRPYIIGGGGLYREDCSDCGESSEAENKAGIDIGAGVQIPLSGFTSLIEARWHMIFDSEDTIADDSNTTFISISAGLLFR